MAGWLMDNYLEILWKEMIVANLRYSSDMSVLRKQRKILVGIAGPLAFVITVMNHRFCHIQGNS
jgi:hypothetical protein